ncbi:hypothetical protein A6P54_18045 [Bacillus sp. MKU004]|nr:hypothetical protein A6P54_18045 [Bacillus sp. MKU004]
MKVSYIYIKRICGRDGTVPTLLFLLKERHMDKHLSFFKIIGPKYPKFLDFAKIVGTYNRRRMVPG